jgi:hypothetical protein
LGNEETGAREKKAARAATPRAGISCARGPSRPGCWLIYSPSNGIDEFNRAQFDAFTRRGFPLEESCLTL